MASFIASKISSATPISGSISEDSGSVGAVSGSGGAIDSSGDELTFSEELTPIVDGVSTSSISHWLRFSVAIVDKLTTSLIILGFSPFKSGMSIGSAVWGGECLNQESQMCQLCQLLDFLCPVTHILHWFGSIDCLSIFCQLLSTLLKSYLLEHPQSKVCAVFEVLQNLSTL